jgi:uncharacterized protein YdaU (DUF1376 family)
MATAPDLSTVDIDLPYMRLWISDLLADPAVWSMDHEEFGVYMKLLCLSWKERGVVPADPKERAKLLGLTSRRLAAIWKCMESKWVPDGNTGLVNPKQEREREEARKLHLARKAAGAKGGSKSKRKPS